MSSSLYPLGRESFLKAEIALQTDDIRCAILSATYVYSDAHQFHSSLTGIIASMSTGMTGKTTTAGVFDADDVTFPTVTAGQTITGLVIYKWTGTSGTSRLIAFFDHTIAGSATSVPTDGSNVPVHWPSGATKIFRI